MIFLCKSSEDGSDEWCNNGLEACKCLASEFCNKTDHFCQQLNGTINNRPFEINPGSGSFLFDISIGDEEEIQLNPCLQNGSTKFHFDFYPISLLLTLLTCLLTTH